MCSQSCTYEYRTREPAAFGQDRHCCPSTRQHLPWLQRQQPPRHEYTVPKLGVSISCVTEFILNAFFMLKEKLGEIAYKDVFMNLSLDFIPLPEDECFRPSNAARQRTSHQWQRGLRSWDKKHC